MNRVSQSEPEGLNDLVNLCLNEIRNLREQIVDSNSKGTQSMSSCGGAERRVTCDAEGCHNHNVGVTCPTESSGILRKSGRDDSCEKSRARVDFKAVFNTNESSSSSKDVVTAAPSVPDPISSATDSQSKKAKSHQSASPEEDLLNLSLIHI